jgi:hypothetical protein
MYRYCAAVAALFAATVMPLQSSAAPNGLAWDAVTKIVMNADPASLQPGSFDSDYAAAASVQQPAQNGGGIFSQIKQAMSAGQNMQQMMQNGFATRHYVAGSKARTDELFSQTATIIDCAARTITTLDLRRKTYRVVSMDQPSAGAGAGGAPSTGFKDNGTRVAISVTNSALGSREVSGQATSGFRSDLTITTTNSSGTSNTQNADLLAYYSNYANPAPMCSRFSIAGAGVRGAGMMAGYAQLMRALGSAGSDSRFSVKQSGPPLPLANLSMYDAVTFGAQGQGATFVTERGNVRAIDVSDPVFSIPPGFTQQQ